MDTKTAIRTEIRKQGWTVDQFITTEDVMAFLERHITEDNTDEVLDILMGSVEDKLPWYVPAVLARRVIDGFLPEGLLTGIRTVLRRVI